MYTVPCSLFSRSIRISSNVHCTMYIVQCVLKCTLCRVHCSAEALESVAAAEESRLPLAFSPHILSCLTIPRQRYINPTSKKYIWVNAEIQFTNAQIQMYKCAHTNILHPLVPTLDTSTQLERNIFGLWTNITILGPSQLLAAGPVHPYKVKGFRPECTGL